MTMTVSSLNPARARSVRSDSDRLILAGLEAIIDATAGILAAQSLEATLRAMADALASIVPYTSLAVFEIDWVRRIGVPLLATGNYVEETMTARPALDNSITGLAATSGQLVYHGPGDPQHHKFVMPGTPVMDVESILVAPLRVGDEVRGTLNVWREGDDPSEVDSVRYQPDEMLLLERFASLAALAYINSSQREQLRAEALTDKLTGLRNRRHCDTLLADTLKEGRRRGEPTSIVCFDIDGFKAINDTFGHAAGDDALRRFGEVLGASTRAGDTPCRTGGEEFTAVLPRTTGAEAHALAERIVATVREAGLGPLHNLTVSAGVATSVESATDPDSLSQWGDQALLVAKRTGRDRVVVAA